MRKLLAEIALTPDGWQRDVLVGIGADGRIASVVPETQDHDAECVDILLPALCNLHSHAFQRAMAGLTQRRGTGDDDFWSWREAMYGFVRALTPEDVEAIAAQLHVELLESGFAAIAEFHYLHHDLDGAVHTDPAEMSGRVAAAAATSGIGLTHLPVLYAHSDFGGKPPGEGQKRFLNDPDGFLRLRECARAHLTRDDDGLGVAFHSLRAVTPDQMTAVLAGASDGPVHIHIAEQVREVEACLDWSGQSPVDWLLSHVDVDERWCLVHATHMTAEETARLARSGAVAGLCPTTEADLGDGIFPGHTYREAGGRWGVGTDSHIRADAVGELCLLEWSQRLGERRRNVMAEPGQSTGRHLYDSALSGGAQALGRASGGIKTGLWADLVALDTQHPLLSGQSGDAILDAWIFSGGRACVSDVWSAGRHVVRDGRHIRRDEIARGYRGAMTRLMA
ncbi:formimidoylglutamate deiminase [Hyphobacterium marinum]|uniref:Formimidoylglutamate deiminase n=1 Tax=Hyphobacterium marinum TaxID=3116574 RepID=A0ABU7LYV3_9PROT|nr:formimidoylglutamate deiminase [Hyphobacterium sp. Y6023]MEE2566734.1 formimidoylglutamate deiminase [Hyphobacterium sp. Y6023]